MSMILCILSILLTNLHIILVVPLKEFKLIVNNFFEYFVTEQKNVFKHNQMNKKEQKSLSHDFKKNKFLITVQN